eukprot:COSAG01_NODE_8188_length_2885_cov_14.256281_1_plen_340_part_10
MSQNMGKVQYVLESLTRAAARGSRLARQQHAWCMGPWAQQRSMKPEATPRRTAGAPPAAFCSSHQPLPPHDPLLRTSRRQRWNVAPQQPAVSRRRPRPSSRGDGRRMIASSTHGAARFAARAAPAGFRPRWLSRSGSGGGSSSRHSSSSSSRRRRSSSNSSSSSSSSSSRLTAKQLAEIKFYRSLATRLRSQRELHRGGRSQPQRRHPRDHERQLRFLFGDAPATAGINFAKNEDVPVEIRAGRGSEQAVRPLTSFADIEGLPEFLARNVERCSYDTPTAVQKHAIPIGLESHDVMCCSQTGSGKTAAFLLPAIAQLGQVSVGERGGFAEREGAAAPRML